MKKYFCDKCDGYSKESTYLNVVTLSSESGEDKLPGLLIIKEFCDLCLKRMGERMNETDPKAVFK